VFAGQGPVDGEHVSDSGSTSPEPETMEPMCSGDRSLEEVEIEAIRATLKKTGWNRTQAARILCISRRTLIEKIHRYKLRPG
ncbi:MAG: helix-turn-helix domain-containing protein, partial [Candidatus Riflebacteria bacterium]|nr:helix-turn-helix domain-containing protein [Candidatus Riflebacteria bacterium]